MSRQPSLNGGSRLSERPPGSRKFVSRRRLGGANSNTTAAISVTPISSSTVAPVSSTTRRGFRIGSRRRPLVTSTTASTTTTVTTPTTTQSTQVTTNSYEDDESLQEIGDTDAIEEPSLEPKITKTSDKVQRRPLITLKDEVNDQNPSATNEEENKRQSKKYSASIKKNQLDELVKRSQGESSTELGTTVEDFSPETAVAIAAHKLITAPIPSFNIFDHEEVKPTKKSQTTVEYKYSSREYNEFTDSRTPSYDDQTTPSYKISTIGNDETTAYKTIDFDSTKIADLEYTKDSDYDSTKVTNFDSTKVNEFNLTESTDTDAPKTDTTRYFTTPQYKTVDYVQSTAGNSYTVDIESPRISTYDVPKPTNFPNTPTIQDYIRTTNTDFDVSEYVTSKNTPMGFVTRTPTTNPTNAGTPREYFRTTIADLFNTPDDFDSKFSTYFGKSSATNYPTNTGTQDYIRSTGNTFPETSTEYISRYSNSYVPQFSSTDSFSATLSEINLPKIATSLTPPPTPSKTFERTTASLVENSPRTASSFTSRTSGTSRLKGFRSEPTADIVTPGYSGAQRGSRFRNQKLIPVPVDDSGFSTAGYTGSSQEPSYFTREYLLESPVTKSYDEEYQYLSPATTPQTPTPTVTRKIVRKKIQRKISTTQRPTTVVSTTPSTTTIRPRRIPAKPFEKVSKEPKRKYRPIANYDYYDDNDEKMATKYVEGTKVVMHENGNIECLDIGNFPHPTSCKKFISCARIENGSLLGWEYICPKGLSFDPVGGICNWSAGLGCNEKDA